MSQDTSVSIRFNVNASQLKKMFQQLNKISTRIKAVSKDMSKLGRNFKQLDSKVKSASNKSKKFTNALKSQESKQKKTAASLQRLTKNTNKYNKATKKTGAGSKTAAGGISLLGFRMLALGGMATFAAQQMRDTFIRVLEESVTILGEINRISLFSDVGFLKGEINPEGFGNAFDLTIDKADEFGLLLTELPTLLKEVEKASPSSIAIDPFRDAVLGFKVLENEVSATALAGDLSTVLANFPEEEIEDVSDLLFAFSKESKLSFTAGSKAIAFASQSAKLLNTDLDELLGVMVNIVAAVPGERGNAGRSIRAFIANLVTLESVAKFKARGIPILEKTADGIERFVGLEKILTGFAAEVKEIRDTQGDLAQIAFLEEFGLDRNAFTGLLAFVNATDEAKEEARKVFSDIGGIQSKAVADQIKRPEAAFNRLKNIMTRVKLEFTQGLAPALNELNALFGSLLKDDDFIEVIRTFSAAIGSAFVTIASDVLPVFRFFGNLLKENAGFTRLLGTATVFLVGALTAMGVIFLVAGSVAMLISVYQKLMEKSKLLRVTTTFLGKTFGRLLISMRKAAVGIANAFRGVGQKIVGGITGGLKFLIPKFIAAGARAGLFFGAAFNILANAFIGAGAWLVSLFKSIGAKFIIAGAAIGSSFGAAFTSASRVIMAAGAWLTTLIATIAIRLGLGGAVTGVAFGTGFTVSSGATMRNGAWISRVIASISVRFAAFGAAIGAAFGAVWTAGARVVMVAGAWISTVMAKIGIASKLGGASAGALFGTAFVVAVAAILALGLADIIGEILFKESILRRLGLPSVLDVAKQTTGVEIPTGVLGGPPGTVAGALDTDRKFNEFFESLKNLFQIPEAFGANMDTFVELQDEQNDLLETSNPIVATSNVLSAENNKTIKKHMIFLGVLIDHIRINIVEVIKNVNMISSLTTTVAATQLMFANLIAQGNRAAGKLSSLRVSKEGKFSISDPGVSGADRSFINQAQVALATARNEQVFLEQNIQIEINPVITVENANGENASEVADSIANELETTLQKRIASIVST